MKVNEDGLISSFIEKPKRDILPDWVSDTGADMQSQGRHYLASMGIYIFNKKLLFDLLLEEYKDSTDFGKEIMPKSIVKYRVASYQYDGYWTDIGNIYSFFEANLALTEDIPQFNLYDNTQTIYTRARMLPPAKLSGTTLEHTIIAEASIINASRIEKSVIGIRSRIGHGTNLVSCYMMGADYFETLDQMASNKAKGLPKIGIGERCYLKNCIIDKNVRMGDDVRIIGGAHLEPADHPLYTIKDGIVVIKKNAIVPSGFQL
jgi:glucose-1-phosphate adenylyltransferase